jgi:hypothetical protein
VPYLIKNNLSGQNDDEELSSDDTAHPFMMKELWRYLQCLKADDVTPPVAVRQHRDDGSFVLIVCIMLA